MKKVQGTGGTPSQATHTPPSNSKKPKPKKKRPAEAPLNRPRLVRFARIHQALQGGKPVTCKELAELLGYSRDTIKRDLNLMRDSLNLPLEYSESAHNWRYTEEAVPFPLMPMTAGDFVALVIACGALESYGKTSFGVKVRAAVDKLSTTCGPEANVDWAAIQSMISFQPAAFEVKTDMDLFASITDAMIESQVIEFHYQKPRDAAPSPRSVRPLHLAYKGTWYLFAQDPSRDDKIRTFALTRMSLFRTTNRKFKRPEDYRPEKELLHSIGIWGGDKPERIRLRASDIAARIIGECPWHRTQQIVHDPEKQRFEVTMDVAVNPELEQRILGWGSEVQVLEPEGLRLAIRAQAQAILDQV